jgi:carbonic anhydrase/acetyltransferase-like protein (isoleucine patch superfamily)
VPIYALDYAAPAIDPQAFVHPDAVVIGAVELAAGSSVWPGAVLRGDHGLIKVGERTSIQDGTIVHTTEELPTVIGAGCVVGHRAHLEGCVVEDGCLIGSGSLVLNRARVAAGAVVAAAALVLEDMTVPAGALAIGVPASSSPGSSTRCRPTWTWLSGTVPACAGWTGPRSSGPAPRSHLPVRPRRSRNQCGHAGDSGLPC